MVSGLIYKSWRVVGPEWRRLKFKLYIFYFSIYPFGMNTQGGFCDFAVLSLKQMAKKKFIHSFATKRKSDWLKAQWVNETCRDLQAKVIKTAAFCHNRALQDLFPDSYRLLFTTGSFNSIASPLSNEPDVQRVQRVRMEG